MKTVNYTQRGKKYIYSVARANEYKVILKNVQ